MKELFETKEISAEMKENRTMEIAYAITTKPYFHTNGYSDFNEELKESVEFVKPLMEMDNRYNHSPVYKYYKEEYDLTDILYPMAGSILGKNMIALIDRDTNKIYSKVLHKEMTYPQLCSQDYKEMYKFVLDKSENCVRRPIVIYVENMPYVVAELLDEYRQMFYRLCIALNPLDVIVGDYLCITGYDLYSYKQDWLSKGLGRSFLKKETMEEILEKYGPNIAATAGLSRAATYFEDELDNNVEIKD